MKQLKGHGTKIKEFRLLRKLSQEDLGKKVDVTKSFISKVENEKTEPSLEMLNKIAEALNVDIVEFFDNKIRPPEKIREVGGQWLVLGEKLEKEGITPNQVEAWAEIVTKYTKND